MVAASLSVASTGGTIADVISLSQGEDFHCTLCELCDVTHSLNAACIEPVNPEDLEIIALIGAGGFASVFAATDRKSSKPFALKMMVNTTTLRGIS